MLNWPSAFAVVGAIIGIALMFNGFPDITIGGKHEHHYHNNEEED